MRKARLITAATLVIVAIGLALAKLGPRPYRASIALALFILFLAGGAYLVFHGILLKLKRVKPGMSGSSARLCSDGFRNHPVGTRNIPSD